MTLEAWEAGFNEFKTMVETYVSDTRERMKTSSHPERLQQKIDRAIETFEASRQRQLTIFAEKRIQLQQQQEGPLRQHDPFEAEPDELSSPRPG